MKKAYGSKQYQGNEPTEEELITFHKLLKSNNQEAKNTYEEYTKNQNKDNFYQKIIKLCRNVNNVTNEDVKSHSRRENRRVCYLFPEGKCSRGSDCKFEHVLDRPIEEGVKTSRNEGEKKDLKPVCLFFESGVCRKADRCKFRHPNGIRNGNLWKNPHHSSNCQPNNDVIDGEVIVHSISSAETESAKENISSPILCSNQSLQLANEDENDDQVGRSLLQNPEDHNVADFSLPQDGMKGNINSVNGNSEERIRIFEFLVDHNERPLINKTPESDSLWMALNLGKINNSFDVFPEGDGCLIAPTKQDVDAPGNIDSLRAQKNDGTLFSPESFHIRPGGEPYQPSPLYHPQNEKEQSHPRPSNFDPKFHPNGFPGPEFPFYPPPPHMIPHQMPPAFMMPGYHPGMYPPPHMMGMPPFPPFPGIFPPHMPPFPPDTHRSPDLSLQPPQMPPRMPYPYGYAFPHHSFPDGSLPLPPQFTDNALKTPQEENPGNVSQLSQKAHDVNTGPAFNSFDTSEDGLVLKAFQNLNATENLSQQNSRFLFEDSMNSFLPQDELFRDNIESSHNHTPAADKSNDPKAQVLLSFLHSKGSSPQLQHNEKVDTAHSDSGDLKPPINQQVQPSDAPELDGKDGPTPHIKLHRVTRNQRGRLRVLIQNVQVKSSDSKSDESSILPGGQMLVSWQLPLENWRESSGSLVVALTRLGSSSNSNNIVMKELKGSRYVQQKNIRVNPNSSDARGFLNEDQEHDVMVGEISFHAPKAAGYYVFRIFDNSNDEKRCITLATSSQFVVELRGRDVAINLKFAIEAIGKTKSDIGSLGALRNTFELMRSTGTPFQGRSPQSLIQECVQLVLEVIRKQIPILNERDEARRIQLTEKPEETHEDQDGKADSTDALWQKARSAQKVHIAAYDCLTALRGNIIAWGMLTPPFKQNVVAMMNQFCQFERRFFDNLRDMYSTRSMDFGFVPCPPLQSHATSNAARSLSSAIKQRVGTLIPTSLDFYYRREEVRTRLRTQLCERSVIPSTADLVLFGSSRNNFGSDSADLDMCLQYSDASTVPIGEQRATVMEALGAALSDIGMSDVQTRSTARIPIVIFKDPISGLDCDISFNNPLAIRNTLLLASYSAIDIRVRELAFIIKYWAKQRYINNPQDGTLSSYGYILCLIHFLQIRNPMIVPNLQTIPPDWEPGRPFDRSNLPKRWEKHPVEDCYCNTYYYDLTHKRELQKCQLLSSNNHQSIGELLVEFFRYFAYEFDYHTNVISIRTGSNNVTKLFKAETDCWGTHDRLSIEDPFETWYDVAHVIKGAQMSYMRKEFLRAYTLICRSCVTDTTVLGNATPDALPQTIPLAELFDILTSPPTEIPKFAQTNKIARSRANTLADNEGEA